MRILEKGELASHEAVEQVEKKKKKIFRSMKQLQISEKFKELFNVMSPRYLLYTPANEILEHIQLYKSLDGADFVWNIAKASDANTRRVNICAKDRPGLFSKIAGNFTLNNFDILSTQVYTWRNHIALDIFEVKAPLDEIFETDKWVRAEKSLSAALAGRLDLASALGKKMISFRSIAPRTSGKPNKVVVDNTSSSFFTIIEVFTYDFPGLLFCIADAIFRCRLDIWVAKIATKVDQVVDVFYVRDFDGQPVDSPDQENKIIEAIHEVLPVY
jgi:[protein-PII] uridylyltransferase